MKDKKKHLTLEGLQKIVNIRASMNKGHTPVLKAAFPNTIPAPRVLIEDKKIKDPN
jgi:formaldehyde-activating enzyme involved in methanogenesis